MTSPEKRCPVCDGPAMWEDSSTGILVTCQPCGFERADGAAVRERVEASWAASEAEHPGLVEGDGKAPTPEALLGALGALPERPELATVEALLRRLSEALTGTDRLAREFARERAVRALSGKVKAPGRLVDAALGVADQEADGDLQGRPVALPEVEPWLDPVDGAELLEGIGDHLARHMALTPGAREVLALFAVVTHAMPAFQVAPYVALESPTPECGKSRLLELLRPLVLRGWHTLMPSTAVLFRVLEQYGPTVLMDESEAVRTGRGEAALNVRDLLLGGYRRGATVPRCVGDTHQVHFFEVFGPKVFALVGELPAALRSRCIRIPIRRRRPDEQVEPVTPAVEVRALELARRARRWAEDHLEELKAVEVVLPEGVEDRAAEVWSPLFAVATVAGGEWPRLAAEALEALSGGRSEADARELLLADLRELFEGEEAIPSAALVEALAAMEDRPWPEWRHGKPITTRQLAAMLRGFDVRPRDVWTAEGARKGYRARDLADAWGRYLPPSDPRERENPRETGPEGGFLSARQDARLADEKRRKPPSDRDSRGIADGATPAGGILFRDAASGLLLLDEAEPWVEL